MISEDYVEESASAMSLEEFVLFLEHVANSSMKTVRPGGHVGFIIMKQLYRLPANISFIDWPFVWYRMFIDAGGTPVARFYNAWPTTIWSAFHVTNAKLEKKILPIIGELCVFKRPEVV